MSTDASDQPSDDVGSPVASPLPTRAGDDVADALAAARAARRPVAVATVIGTDRSVPRHAGAKMLVRADGTTVGTVGGGEMESRVVTAALDTIDTGRPQRLVFDLVEPASGDPGVCGGQVELFIEPVLPPPTLLVLGLGHVGRAVAELAGWLGFRVVGWDDRPEVATSLGGADVVASGELRELLDAQPVDDRTSIVLVTRNVALDRALLPHLVGSPARYLGVMGSSRRWATTRAQLADSGIDETLLDRVQSPIGMQIDAETPAEIAVSIMSEVIRVGRTH